MSRQDANAIFAHTSFLYGGNAAYIEDLYAKFEWPARPQVRVLAPRSEGRRGST